MLVIADATRAQAVAGVMGGATSEVSATTRLVAFESACFQPASVRRTSKRLGLKTEASSRFERGADINAPVVALERALALMELIGAGRASAPSSIATRHRAVRARSRCGGRASHSSSDSTCRRRTSSASCARLACRSHQRSDGWDVQVPTFRVDLLREVDLIEEVGRHYGFDKLEPTFPPMTSAAPPPDPRVVRDRPAAPVTTAAGLSEAVTFGFIERAAAELVR